MINDQFPQIIPKVVPKVVQCNLTNTLFSLFSIAQRSLVMLLDHQIHHHHNHYHHPHVHHHRNCHPPPPDFENGEIYTAGKNFTLLPALTAWTNSTSGYTVLLSFWVMKYMSITLIPKHRSRGILTRYSNIPHISSIPHTRILRYALIHVSMHTSGYLRIDHNDSSKPSHRLTIGPEPSKTIESDGSNIKKTS